MCADNVSHIRVSEKINIPKSWSTLTHTVHVLHIYQFWLCAFVCVCIKPQPNSRSFYFASPAVLAPKQFCFVVFCCSSLVHSLIHPIITIAYTFPYMLIVNVQHNFIVNYRLSSFSQHTHSLGIIKIYLTVLQLLWALHCFCFASLHCQAHRSLALALLSLSVACKMKSTATAGMK